MAGRERRRSSAASLELSAASRAAWVAAGRSAALIAARASSENLTSCPFAADHSVHLGPDLLDLRTCRRKEFPGVGAHRW